MIYEITSLKNDWVKRAASLKQKKYRVREGLFLVEGKRAVSEARDSGWAIECYFYTTLPEVWEDPAKSPVTYYHVTDAVFRKAADTEDPQGIGALVRIPEQTLQAFAPKKGLVLVLAGIQDPGNAGTLIRSADAMGAVGVVCLDGTVDLYNPKVVRSTMGSLFHLPVFTNVAVRELKEWSKAKEIPLWATALNGAEDVTKLTFPPCSALILGSEGNGVPEVLLSMADKKVKIPMFGHAESLNVAIAGSILLFAAATSAVKNE